MLTEEMLKLIDEHCTVDQIQNLLREYKEDYPKTVFVAGDAKSKVIDNLKKASDAGAIPLVRVQNLLRECEENGRQHIFYYTPDADTLQQLRKPEECAAKLIGKNWMKMGFPRYEERPLEYVWVDFRVKEDGRASNWIAKLYGHEEHEVFVSEERGQNNRITRYYQLESSRAIGLIRWHNRDKLLEIRVSTAPSQAIVRSRLETVQRMIEPLLNPDFGSHFAVFDLSGVMKDLILYRQQNSHVYTIHNAVLIDSESGKVIFRPQVPEESIDGAVERGRALDGITRHRNSEVEYLTLTWLESDSGTNLDADLHCVLGGRGLANRMIIQRKTTSKAIEYVKGQLITIAGR